MRETSGYFGWGEGEYLNDKVVQLSSRSVEKNISVLYSGINKLKELKTQNLLGVGWER
jgi:hypothetical protein